MKVSINNYNYYIEDYLIGNLDLLLNKGIPNKWDGLFIIFGKEGAGKSTLTSQMALYTDHNYNLSNCCFTPDQFDYAIDNAKDKSSIVYDEAITGANAQEHANKVCISIISKLTQIRKKRLKIFLCFPYLYMLNKYFINRCICSIYTYAKDFDDRGYAYFYSQPRTEMLYNLMKEVYKYNYQKAISKVYKNFYFKFPSKFCLNELDYDKKKESSRKNKEDNKITDQVFYIEGFKRGIKPLDWKKLFPKKTVSIYLASSIYNKTK